MQFCQIAPTPTPKLPKVKSSFITHSLVPESELTSVKHQIRLEKEEKARLVKHLSQFTDRKIKICKLNNWCHIAQCLDLEIKVTYINKFTPSDIK